MDTITLAQITATLSSRHAGEVGWDTAVRVLTDCAGSLGGLSGALMLLDAPATNTGPPALLFSVVDGKATDWLGSPLDTDEVESFLENMAGQLNSMSSSRLIFTRGRLDTFVSPEGDDSQCFAWLMSEGRITPFEDGFFIHDGQVFDAEPGPALEDNVPMFLQSANHVQPKSLPLREMKEREAEIARADTAGELFFKKIWVELPDGIHKVSVVTETSNVASFQFLKEAGAIYGAGKNRIEDLSEVLGDFFMKKQYFMFMLRSTAVPFPRSFIEEATTKAVNSLESDVAMWLYTGDDVIPQTAQNTRDFICISDLGVSEAPSLFRFVDAWDMY